MERIDSEAAGILIGNGCDPLTAVAGSVIEGQRPPALETPRARWLRHIGLLIGVGLVLAWAILRTL